MSNENQTEEALDQWFQGLNAATAGLDPNGPMIGPSPMMELPASSYADIFPQLQMRQFGKSCWMNVGHASEPDDFSKACEKLFCSMFEGQEQYLFERENDVLDTSSGYGDQYLTLAKILKKKFSYVGVNPDPFQNTIAGIRTGFRVPFFQLSAGKLALLPPASYDMVLAHENAFHYKSRKAYLTNVHRVLRPGGMLLIHDILSVGKVRYGHGLHTIDEYVAFAKGLGFEICCARDISDQILMDSFDATVHFYGLDGIDCEAGRFAYTRFQLQKKKK